MDSLIHKINLDCLRKDSQAIVNAKIGEASGRKIVFTLYEGRAPFFVPSDTTAVFRAKKPSGAVLYNNCVVDDGKIEYTITSQTVAEKGVFPCEIQIIGADNKVIYTPCITLNVTENLYSDTEVESSNEFTELENALNRIPSLEVIYSKYTKPEDGIPKSDLAQDVQNSLNKADTALQEHQSLAAYRTAEAQDIIDSTKQDKLIAGDNITIAADGKTISAIVDGTSVSMRVDGGYIQYSTDNGNTWNNLIAKADLKGDKGDKGGPGAPGKDGAPGVYYGTTQPTGDTHPVWIDPDGDHDDGGLLPAVTASDNGKVLRVVSGAWSPVEIPSGGGVDMGITGATVGQIAKITAVDASGAPTAWSPVDMPTGGGGSSEGIGELRRIAKVTLTEDASSIEITTDEDGNAFELVEYTYLITGKSLGTVGNVGLKINDTLIYYETDLSSSNTTATLIAGGHGSYTGGWYATYKYPYNASVFGSVKGACKHNIGKMVKFWYGCTNGAAGVGFQAGTVLELWGR